MKVLVTGVGGFIGFHVSKYLLERGDTVVGLDNLKAFHLNDSKKPLGSRVDRHTHIGRGHIGTDTFARLLRDARFRDIPMLLETPKSGDRSPSSLAADPMDLENLTVLRRLR